MISKKDLKRLLARIDFTFEEEEDGISLTDLQGANLGGIESERFTTCEQVVDRLDIYWEDEFLKKETNAPGKDFASYEDALIDAVNRKDPDDIWALSKIMLLDPQELLSVVGIKKRRRGK